MRRRRRVRPLEWDRLDDRCLLSGLTPAQLTAAYGLNSINFTSLSGSIVHGTGAGETIALIEAYHDPTLVSDLQKFDANFGLPDPAITVVDQAGQSHDDGWLLEESLDVEWAHAVAPGANLLVVEASSQSLSALVTAINTARDTPGVVAVSMSWGFSEFRKETADNPIFTTPSGHTGITFVAASGDSGSSAGPEWPSSAPTVLAVGGTTLYVDGAGNYQYELPWIGSGGGYSRIQPEPGYQRSVQGTGQRSTPDVAFNGDPNTGVLVYETSAESGVGSWQVVGGTSLGTPAWAALIAIVDQGRNLAGEGSLDGGSQTLPDLYALPSSAFHVVGSSGTRQRATANVATGRGTPVGSALVAALVADNSATPLTTSTAVAHSSKRSVRARAKTAAVHRLRESADVFRVGRATNIAGKPHTGRVKSIRLAPRKIAVYSCGVNHRPEIVGSRSDCAPRSNPPPCNGLRINWSSPIMRNRRRDLRPGLCVLDDRCLLSGYGPAPQGGYTPAQITGAYGLNAITFTSSTGTNVTGNGSGETIALIETYHDPSLKSDLKTFDASFGLPNPTLTVVDQAGNQTNSGWALEESMDVEWAHAIAPAASILVIEAAPASTQNLELKNLLGAVNTARNTAGVVAVSMSWGFDEMPNESAYDSYFTTPAGHAGITFIASSGDNAAVEYPSASPNVLSVGGTSLSLGGVDGYGSETAWTSGGEGIASTSPSQSIKRPFSRRDKEARPTSPSTATPIRVSRSIRPLPALPWEAGRSSAAPAWAPPHGPFDRHRRPGASHRG